MATDYPSSNPFRRKAPPSTTASASAPAEHPSILNHIAYQQTDTQPPSDSTNASNVNTPKKTTKKVRVQSPPPPSPSIPDSSSTIGEDAYSISAKPPTPIPRDENDPFDSTTDDTSEDEPVSVPKQAPANPFQKTLETMEHPVREGPVTTPTNVASPGKASLDVDAFKRLLMTGNAGLGISTPPTTSQAAIHHGLGDGGSSTDTSSISRQSIFEPIQEAHPESPRTSHEISEPEDDHRGLTAEISTAGRKKPPPPSSRYGKLIKVELRDEPSSIPLASPRTPSSSSSNQFFNSSPAQRSQTDLNKPLPPAPARASHDSEDRESVFDKESAGKTPEPPSPSASLRRKTPPAPPLTRRHSQMVADSKLTTRGDTGRLSPKAEEDSLSIISAMEIGRPRSDSARAPPPPPSRRPASVRGSSHHVPLTSPSTMSLPPIPPARGSSRSISGRPLSIASMDISSPPISASNTPSKRASMMPPPPPPPPPPRHGRTSMEEGSRRTSSDHGRRSMDSARRGSETSSITKMDRVESPEPVGGGQDILAEMSKLQREIDEMRAKSERVT